MKKPQKSSTILAFVTASSIPVTIWPIAGLGIAVQRSGAEFNFAIAAVLIPFVFGSYHAICRQLQLTTTPRSYLYSGMLLGLIMASIGTFAANVPEVVYGLTGNSRYLALIGGPIFYGVIWRFGLWPLDKLLVYDN